MSDQYVLAIDLGTSGPKVALVSMRGEVLGYEIEPTGIDLTSDGKAEQDPDEWWSAISTASQRLMARGLVAKEAVVAVCASAQWSGTVAVGADGRHVMNAITWLDTRGAKYVKQTMGGVIGIQGYGAAKLLSFVRKTGGMPSLTGKDPIGHILFIKHELPEIYTRTAKFLEPKDYLNLRMTGRVASSFEAIILHWVTDNREIDDIHYDEGLLRTVGIDRDKLPDLKQATDILGPLTAQAAADLGVNADIAVVMGTPDVQAATVGSGAVRDYEAHLYIGTSSWCTCHVPFKKTDVVNNMASLPSAIAGRYYVANEQETSGACLTFLRDNLLYPDDAFQTGKPPADFWARLNAAAESAPPGSDKVIFTPWLFGERTPIDDHTVRAGFFNVSLGTTRAHLTRAVMEGVALNMKWLLGAVESFIKKPVEYINIIGGGANSPLWCQIQADVLDREIRQVKDPVSAGPRGVAFLAAVGLGHLTFEEIGDLVPIQNTFTPNPDNRKIYDSLFHEYKQIYKRNKGMYARLNGH